jgi:predicted KAP-like P-loop ATPase
MSDKPDSKDINNELSSLDETVEEIISELPLKERAVIANMTKVDFEMLKNVFNKYVRGKTDTEVDDSEYTNIMNKLWEKLRQTHKLRVIK